MADVEMKKIICQDSNSLLQLSSNPLFLQHHFFRSQPTMVINCLSSLVLPSLRHAHQYNIAISLTSRESGDSSCSFWL